MALIKQVVSAANGTVTNVPMAEEEAAFLAQQAADQAAVDAQAARTALRAEQTALLQKLTDALISGDPVDPVDVARYKQLKATP